MILFNGLMCPDGTIICSNHRHDFRVHTTDERQISFIDGGKDCVRFGGGVPITITDKSPFEVIRVFLSRYTRGKNFDEPLMAVPLYQMTDEHLDNTIIYEEEHRPENPLIKYYKLEQEYRKTK